MTDPLMLHQILGIKFLKDMPRCLLADEAGLGKSRQVLEAAKHFIIRRGLLVLCPTSLVENWKEEARKWDFPLHKITVIGYEYQFLHQFKDLKTKKWGVIVADEAHMLKNWTAQRTKLFRDLIARRDSKIWLLTGTPLVNGAQDLHPLLSFIEPGIHGKYREFCEKFCRKKPDQWSPGGFKYFGVKEGKILNVVLNRVMLRRYKHEEIEEMPDRIISRVPIVLPGSQLDIFTSEGIVRAAIKAATQGGTVDEELTETLQQLGLKKVDHAVKFITDTLHPHPLVIFAHHRLVLYDIAEKLRDQGRKVAVIIGGMDKTMRHEYVRQFQAGKLDDLVCSIQVAGVGINLFRSSRCVVAEFPWTWAALSQAIDRLHRIGQKDCVNAYLLHAKGTFEEAILNTIYDKRLMMEEVVEA